MAIRIISPEFSFVRFSDQHLEDANWLENQIPGAELGVILPVSSFDDYAFQFVAETDTEDEADTLCDVPMTDIRLMRVAGSDLGPTITKAEFDALAFLWPTDSLAELGGGRYRLDTTHVLYYWPRMPFDLTGVELEVACRGCFQLAVQLDSTLDLAQAVSNLFNFQCENTDFTSVLDYYSTKDEASFYYCIGGDTIKNRARLPIYLTRPTFIEDEETLRNSAGRNRVRRSEVFKVYEVVTDRFPVWIIETLRAVFMHDVVFIEESPTLPQVMPYQGQISKEGGYDPVYSDYKNYPLANVAFKVVAEDFQLRKNNCGTCGDYSDMLTTSNAHVGLPVVSSAYEVELLPLILTACCDPVTFDLDHYQTNYIDTINIVTDTLAETVTLEYTTKATFVASPTDNSPFIRVKVTCGGAIKYIVITSDLP